MFLVYKPDGQPEQRWHFLPGRLRTAEMIAIEKRTGLKYGQEFKQDLLRGGTVARMALLWTFQRREHHTLRFEDVDFCDDELLLVQDKDELAAEIAALEQEDIEGLSEVERAAGLALLRRQLAEAPDAPGKAPTGTTAEPAPSTGMAPASGEPTTASPATTPPTVPPADQLAAVTPTAPAATYPPVPAL